MKLKLTLFLAYLILLCIGYELAVWYLAGTLIPNARPSPYGWELDQPTQRIWPKGTPL